jgi:hypothetical protein
MVTSSSMVRGIITALSWFVAPSKRAKVFAPADVEAAFGALALSEPKRDRIYRQIAVLAEDVERRPGPLPLRAHRVATGSSPPTTIR